MNAKKMMMSVAVWFVAVMVVVGFARSASAADPYIPVNVIVNGDFESGPDWGGGTTAPTSWVNYRAGATAYLSPTTGPIAGARSLFTDALTQGQYTWQTGLVMNAHWKLRFDYAAEQPANAQDKVALILVVGTGDFDTGTVFESISFRDVGLDGVLDAGSGFPVPGFVFSTDIVNSPVKHQVIVEGHMDLAIPTFDVIINNASGVNLTNFLGLTSWNSAPTTGQSPTFVGFMNDQFSSGRSKIDNVEMGSWVIPEPSSALLLGLGGMLTLRRFRRR